MDRIPYSAYDFLGHIASGMVILLTIGGPLHLAAFLPEGSVAVAALVTLAAYVVGHAVATPCAAVLEHFLVRRILGHPIIRLLFDGTPSWPLSLIFPGYSEALPKGARSAMEKALTGASIDSTDIEEVAAHAYPLAHSRPSTSQRLDTFLNLYGFSRNMCFALGMSATVALVVPGSHPPTLPGVFGLLAVGMLYRYLKYYRLFWRETLLSAYRSPPETPTPR